MPKEQVLCLSYFDHVIGPTSFYCNEKFNESEGPDTTKILEFNDEPGTFIFAFRDYQTLNHLFYIESKFARGGKEIVMLTYMIKAAYFKNEIIDIFKFLESRTSKIEEFATELTKLEEFPAILHEHKRLKSQNDLFEGLGSESFKIKFLDVFNKYFEILSPSPTLDFPLRKEPYSKKIFIFGAQNAGKSTFLKNIEAIQFYIQKNNDLPSRIYEVVIDNVEILTYDCIDKDFECEKCKNLDGCLKNVQGFILIINLSNEQNILDSRERFQKIVNKCTEITNKPIPVLIIGNKIENQKEVDQKFVQSQFKLVELKECGIKIKYFSINILKDKGKIMEALRWLIRQMI